MPYTLTVFGYEPNTKMWPHFCTEETFSHLTLIFQGIKDIIKILCGYCISLIKCLPSLYPT